MSFDPFAPGSEGLPDLGYRSLTHSDEDVRRRVLVPAIVLIVSGVVSLVMDLFPVIEIFGAMTLSPAQFEAEMEKQNPESRKQMEQLGWTPRGVQRGLAWGFGIWAVVDPLASVLVILGGVCMLRLKAYSLALFASVLSALPFCTCSGCCGLGQVAGLWAIIVLLNPDVKAAFQ